jgi:hypothetical protein
VTTPGVPVSPGFPPLEHAAQSALRAAQQRLDAFTGKAPVFPPPLTREEREEALKDAGSTACCFCAAWHPGASTAACPRLATFKLNGDGQVVEGTFWPDGVTDSAVEVDGDGKVRAATYHRTDSWDTTRVVRVSDAAEEEPEDGEEEAG